jgi:hypothetical protein
MDCLKKISPAWAAVALLVVIVLVLLFRQRRSGYTPAAGTPISLMDLQEFSAFTPDQKTMYMQMITESSAQLSQAAASKSFEAFQSTLSNILRQAIQMPTPVVAAPPPQMAMPTPTPPPQMAMPTPTPPPTM